MQSIEKAAFDYEGAATYLDDSPRHVRRLKDDGVLPYVKLGRKVRFLRRDLDAYLAAARREATRGPGAA